MSQTLPMGSEISPISNTSRKQFPLHKIFFVFVVIPEFLRARHETFKFMYAFSQKETRDKIKLHISKSRVSFSSRFPPQSQCPLLQLEIPWPNFSVSHEEI